MKKLFSIVALMFPVNLHAADHLSKLTSRDVECFLEPKASVKVYFNPKTRSFGVKEGRTPVGFLKHVPEHYDRTLWGFVCSSDTSLEKFLKRYRITIGKKKGNICLEAIKRTKK